VWGMRAPQVKYSLSQLLSAVLLLLLTGSDCFFAEGCSSPSYGTLIMGCAENDELLGGKIAPGNAIKQIVVYLYPPDMYRAEHYEDLLRCGKVEIAGEAPIREFLGALQTWPRGIVNGVGTEKHGTIMVLLRDGKRLYLHYFMQQNAVRLEAPPYGPREPKVEYNQAIEGWLLKYIYFAEYKETNIEPEGR